MKLFEEKYGTLEYDSTVPCIIVVTNSFMTSEQFRSFLNKGLDHFIGKKQHHDKLFWIADTRKKSVQADEDIRWISDDWNPRAMAAGIYHLAFVVPENVFGNIVVKKYAENTEKKGDSIDVQMFDDLQSAKDWCRSLN